MLYNTYALGKTSESYIVILLPEILTPIYPVLEEHYTPVYRTCTLNFSFNPHDFVPPSLSGSLVGHKLHPLYSIIMTRGMK